MRPSNCASGVWPSRSKRIRARVCVRAGALPERTSFSRCERCSPVRTIGTYLPVRLVLLVLLEVLMPLAYSNPTTPTEKLTLRTTELAKDLLSDGYKQVLRCLR